MSSKNPPMTSVEWDNLLTRLGARWSSLSPEKRQEALDRMLELQSSLYQNPLLTFQPNGAQEKLLREIGNPENFVVIAAFANGVGKTSCVFAALAAIMWGAPTSVFSYPIYTNYPKRWPKIVRIVTDPALINDMGPIQIESAKWWPKGRYKWFKSGKMHNSVFVTDSGFQGEVMSSEQAVKEFEGKTTAINVFIEPAPRDIFNACVARQRKGGINILDMTPLTSSAWVMDELVSKPDIKIDGRSCGKVVCINADIEENCRTHGKNGQLEHDDIMRIVSRYDPDEIEARAHGRFMHLSGRIYKTFDRAVHVSKNTLIPPSGVTHRMVCDPAIGKPLAMIWAYIDPTRTLHIYDEWPDYEFNGAKDPNLTVAQYAELIKSRERYPIESRILDRHFGNARRALGGLTLKQEFLEAGIEFEDSYAMESSVEVETGIHKVRDYLAYDKTKPMDSLNRPRIVISPNCTNTIASFERWSRDPKTSKPKEEYKDFADIVRYLAMSCPEIESPVQWNHDRKPYYGVRDA